MPCTGGVSNQLFFDVGCVLFFGFIYFLPDYSPQVIDQFGVAGLLSIMFFGNKLHDFLVYPRFAVLVDFFLLRRYT